MNNDALFSFEIINSYKQTAFCFDIKSFLLKNFCRWRYFDIKFLRRSILKAVIKPQFNCFCLGSIPPKFAFIIPKNWHLNLWSERALIIGFVRPKYILVKRELDWVKTILIVVTDKTSLDCFIIDACSFGHTYYAFRGFKVYQVGPKWKKKN